MDVGRVKALVSELYEATTGSVVPAGEEWRTESGFPKLKTFDGVQVMCMTPINPDWMPSMYAHTLGAQGAYVNDPSAPVGARSPAGYPVYHGSVLYSDAQFANDADLAAWRAQTEGHEQEIKDNEDKINAANDVLQPGMIAISALTQDDVKFWYTFNGELQGVIGPRNVEKTLVDWIANGSDPDPPGMPNLAGIVKQSFQFGNWDWSNYHGILRAKLAAHRGVQAI